MINKEKDMLIIDGLIMKKKRIMKKVWQRDNGAHLV
jgi:hypothetical protein